MLRCERKVSGDIAPPTLRFALALALALQFYGLSAAQSMGHVAIVCAR